MNKKLISGLLIAGGVLVGLGSSIAYIANAQSTATIVPVVTTTSTSIVDTPEAGDVADSPSETAEHGHRDLGGDGVIASINDATIVIAEESDEGSAPYTVDASNATITNNGAVATLADLKVGDKVFVDGTTTGSSVKATSISLGSDGHKESGADSETNDTGTDTGGDQ